MSYNYTVIGKVSPIYKGVWASDVTYSRLDIVSNTDKTVVYIARKDVPTGTGLSDVVYWAAVLDASDVLAELQATADISLEKAEEITDLYNHVFAATKSVNLLNPDELHDGRMSVAGVELSALDKWKYINIDTAGMAGKYINLSYTNTSGNRGPAEGGLRYVTVYEAAGVNAELGTESASTFLIPESAVSVTVTYNSVTYTEPVLSIDDTAQVVHPYEEYFDDKYGEVIDSFAKKVEEAVHAHRVQAWRTSGTLADGDTVTFPVNNIKKNRSFVFSGVINSFDESAVLTLGRKTDDAQQAYITVDNTYVTEYLTGTHAGIKWAHGLTITNNLQVIWSDVDPKDASDGYYGMTIRVVSNGAAFETEAKQVYGASKGVPYITASGCSFGYAASYSCKDCNAPVYAFGDSYFSFYGSRWPYYLMVDGCEKNVLFNAYAGEDTANAMAAFENVMSLGKPRYLLWALGMNDPDADAVNASWQSGYETVKSYCAQNNIELILATIPCVPDRDNSYKNKVVRNSGYRYVDFARAVGAEATGSTWYGGMLDTADNVHPTEYGARALYMQVLADFPEIMVS